MNVEGDKTEIAKIAAGGDAPAASASSSASGPIEMVKAPMDGEGVYVKYVKQVGESVKADELICEIESDKATIEITSPVAGVIKEYLVPQGKEINVEGDATEVVSVQTAGAPAAASEAAPSVSKKKAVTSEPERKKLSRYQVAMAKGMSVGDRDTNCFNLLDRVDFKSKVVQKAKDSGVSPVAVLIKALGTAASNAEMNIKLSKDRTEMKLFPKVNIGCAIDVNGQLRTAVVKDVTSKSYADVMADVKRMAAAGAKLPAEDQNLDEVCFTVSSMGKDATDVVIPVLPKGTTGIMGVGKLDEQGKAFLAMTLCHATMSGVEGSNLMKALHTELDK
ncbi:unnamed protein product [Amoebophrya sp. A25]|nr:unnamed protein product [Amoebophrya sp. A25]|eukprot:GSA25T00019694001.1